jgi:predicted nucleotidyltransferase
LEWQPGTGSWLCGDKGVISSIRNELELKVNVCSNNCDKFVSTHILSRSNQIKLGGDQMSKKVIKLQQIVQDLESRYGASDPDVQNLKVELSNLEVIKQTYREKRRATLPLGRSRESGLNAAVINNLQS